MNTLKFDLESLLKLHPSIDLKVSELPKLRQSQWQRLYDIDPLFRNLRSKMTLEEKAKKEKVRSIGKRTM